MPQPMSQPQPVAHPQPGSQESPQRLPKKQQKKLHGPWAMLDEAVMEKRDNAAIAASKRAEIRLLIRMSKSLGCGRTTRAKREHEWPE
jgi:hypothetical protein